MNTDIIKQIGKDLNIKERQVEVVLNLLKEGNTVPFIARYRKEATGSLDEEVIRSINEVYEYQVNLLKRKEDVIRLIDEKGMLTDELKEEILKCQKLVEVEDLYRPFKEKKKTKATEAIKNGLEPLANMIMEFKNRDIKKEAKSFLNDKVTSIEEAIEGAKYIIAEAISDNAEYRKYIRENIVKFGIITSKLKKKAQELDQAKTYEMYYDYSEAIKSIKPHRVLAINRGEKEGILSVNIDVDFSYIINYLEKKVIKKSNTSEEIYVKEAILDSYKRLIFPSVEREIRSELKETAEITAIDNFSKNVENLLLTPPMKGKTVLGGRAGGMPEMIFEYILKNHGIDPKKDVTIIQNIDFGSTAAAFSGGQGDYSIEFEPYAASLEAQGDGFVLASLGVDSGYVPYTAYCVKKSYMEKSNNKLQEFTNAIQKGLDYVNSHSADEIASVIAPQFSETDEKTIAIIVERYKNQDTWKENTIFEKESFELLQTILKEGNELKQTVPYSKLVTTDYSKQAMKK